MGRGEYEERDREEYKKNTLIANLIANLVVV